MRFVGSKTIETMWNGINKLFNVSYVTTYDIDMIMGRKWRMADRFSMAIWLELHK